MHIKSSHYYNTTPALQNAAVLVVYNAAKQNDFIKHENGTIN